MATHSTAPGPATGPGREVSSNGDHLIIAQPAAAAEVTVVAGSALQLIAVVNEQHRLKKVHADQAIAHAIRCGELLIEQKQCLPQWDFTQWVERNCVFSLRSAREYIRLAEGAQGDSARPLWSIRIPQRRAPAISREPTASQLRTAEQAGDSAQTDVSATTIAIDRAISILDEARLVGNHDKLLKVYESATDQLKQLRQKLGRGEIAQRNAEASVIDAAKRYAQKPQA